MIGIVSIGAYIPLYRLGKTTAGWNAAGEKAIAGFDEDSITMAAEAGIDCLRGFARDQVDGVFLASTTLPYKEKQSATILANVLDVPRSVRAVDYTGTLRSGTIALRSALDAIHSGSAKNVLIAASDCRLAFPHSSLESIVGDSAAALLIGEGDAIATFEDVYTHTDEIVDLWRDESDTFVMTWEDRFGLEKGYNDNVAEAISAVLTRNKLSPKDFNKVVLYGPNARAQQALARKLGFDTKSQLQDSLLGSVGHTGAASIFIMLIAALENANPQDRILVANYSDGCDVFVLKVTESIQKPINRRGVHLHQGSKKILPSYDYYLKIRHLVEEESARRPAERTSAPALWRDRSQVFSLHGGKCRKCGTILFPIQRVCAICQTKDEVDEVNLSSDTGTVFTFTIDHLALTADPPMVKAVVDLQSGARIFCEMTDRNPDEVKIDMPVEMTFRRVKQGSSFPNYFWKCRPIR